MSTICLAPECQQRIEEYAKFAGLTIDQAANEAIEEWMDNTGDLLMAFIQRRREKASKATRSKSVIQIVKSPPRSASSTPTLKLVGRR